MNELWISNLMSTELCDQMGQPVFTGSCLYLRTRECTGWPISWRIWVGLTLILSVPLSAQLCLGWWEIGRTGWAAGQDGGISQIKVNPTQVRLEMGHPVLKVCLTSDYSKSSWTEFIPSFTGDRDRRQLAGRRARVVPRLLIAPPLRRLRRRRQGVGLPRRRGWYTFIIREFYRVVHLGVDYILLTSS